MSSVVHSNSLVENSTFSRVRLGLSNLPREGLVVQAISMTDRFITDCHASLGHHLLSIPITETKPEIQPYILADDANVVGGDSGSQYSSGYCI